MRSETEKGYRQAIEVKYFPPTNTRGARFKATAAAGHCYSSQYIEKTNDENALEAAIKLARRFRWSGVFYGGSLKNGNWVFIQKSKVTIPDFTMHFTNS